MSAVGLAPVPGAGRLGLFALGMDASVVPRKDPRVRRPYVRVENPEPLSTRMPR